VGVSFYPAPLNLGAATPLVESGAGAVGTSSLANHQDHVHPAAASTAFTSGEAKLGANVNTVQGTWTDVLVIAGLAAGTYQIDAYALIIFGAAIDSAQFRIQDTTNGVTLGSAEAISLAGIGADITLAMSKRNYVVVGAWTLKLQVNSTIATASIVEAAITNYGSGNNATGLGWMKTA